MPPREPKPRYAALAGLGCFIALIVAAVVAFVTYLLPLISDAQLGDSVMNILTVVYNVAALIGLCFGALSFASARGKLAKFLTFLAVAIFIAAIVLMII